MQPPFRFVSLEARPLRVPLIEPFVIASATMTTTAAVELAVTIEDGAGRRATGLGEAATLPPVTLESDAAILARVESSRGVLIGRGAHGLSEASSLLDIAARSMPVMRAALEAALADALGKLHAVPVAQLLARKPVAAHIALTTDITVPITDDAAHAGELAGGYARDGFRSFKIKVGRDRAHDQAALASVLAAVPDAQLRLDANGGFSSRDALALLDGLGPMRARVECFEQPCGKHDLDGMAEVTRHGGVPVVADESVASMEDLERVLDARAASGVNLKLVKHGGLLDATRIGLRAQSEGLKVMAGAMVETRLGLVAMGHVVWALGGVDYVDLDTALLLASDPYEGGWSIVGPTITIDGERGLGVRRKDDLG